MTELPLTSELLVLGFSVVLLFVHIMLQGRLATRERGLESVSYTHLTLPTILLV